MNNSDLLSIILLEEEEEEEWLQLELLEKERCEKHDIFKKRAEEGYFSLLINSHLKGDEKKFREFFRLNPEQFNFVLSLIQEDIKKPGTNCVKYPITAEEKLALTLR